MSAWRRSIALKRIWWRHCWTFEWAHKPDCDAYRGETIRLGRLRLCRGCLALYGGIVAGLLFAGVSGAEVFSRSTLTALLLLTIAVTLFSAPDVYARQSRCFRDLLRLTAGIVIGLWSLQFFQGAWFPAGVALLLMAGSAYAYRASRLRLRQDSCASCPESEKEGICSGYQEQASGIRRYEAAATAWMEDHEELPDCLTGKGGRG